MWKTIESVVIKSAVHKDKAHEYLTDHLHLTYPRYFCKRSYLCRTKFEYRCRTSKTLRDWGSTSL